MEIHRDHRHTGLLRDAHRTGLKGKFGLAERLDQTRRADRYRLSLLE